MRVLVPSEVVDLEQASPVVWTSRGEDPGFVFEVEPGQGGFVGFFLATAPGEAAPRITFDQGAGFSEPTALSLKPFPFAFYHVALDKVRGVARIRFRPCAGGAVFRFLPVRTNNAVAVAILHYLFNLRYQNIGLVAAGGGQGALANLGSNLARAAKFFRDVSSGGGVRVQEGGKDMLADLKTFLALEAPAVQAEMDAVLGGRDGPLLSFVSPTYNTSRAYLDDLLRSFAAEGAAYAELILSDDGSTRAETLARLRDAEGERGVRLVSNARNGGIAAATNAGIAAARGEWIAFIDHDDQFLPGAVAVIARAILASPEADFFYTDEILGDGALRPIGSFCKPAFDSVLLSGVNYINHFSVFRRARVEGIGGLRLDREGSQDYDLLLRYLADAKPGAVVHIPFLAYLWRREEGTYSNVHLARSLASARSALRDAFAARGRAVAVEPALDPNLHRVRMEGAPRPKVSVVIPNKNSPELIRRVVGDLRRRTGYPALEVVIVDNGSRDRATLSFYDGLRGEPDVAVDIVEEPFNFSSMCNRGARLASGELLLFLNNDIEVLERDWLAEMVDCLLFEAVGIVGAKLTYPGGLVQHDGVIVGLGEAAGHWYIGEPADAPGPMGRLGVRQTLSAVTGACMLVTRPCFDAVGGFDAEAFPVAYNDIDLCLRARAAGFRTVWTPFAHLVHHESLSRGSDETGVNKERFRVETARLQARHGTATYIDDSYSPFYDRRYSAPAIAVPPGLPKLRPNAFP